MMNYELISYLAMGKATTLETHLLSLLGLHNESRVGSAWKNHDSMMAKLAGSR